MKLFVRCDEVLRAVVEGVRMALAEEKKRKKKKEKSDDPHSKINDHDVALGVLGTV